MAVAEALLHVEQIESNGSDGGSTTAATWVSRGLNTVVHNDMDGASLSEPTITLPAGTFWADMIQTAYGGGKGWGRLYDTTGSVELIRGPGFFYTDRGHQIMGRGQFTLSEESAVVAQIYDSASQSTSGLGVASDGIVTVEKYCTLRIWKRA